MFWVEVFCSSRAEALKDKITNQIRLKNTNSLMVRDPYLMSTHFTLETCSLSLLRDRKHFFSFCVPNLELISSHLNLGAQTWKSLFTPMTLSSSLSSQLKMLVPTAHCTHMSPFRAHQHFQRLPILHLCCLPAATVPSLPARPIAAPGPFSPCNICLSPEMKRQCFPVGLQVAHHEGGQRLIPVIQLCWFTPHIYMGVGDSI